MKELENLTIVVADDERDYVKTVNQFFTEKGARVIPCHCGEEAYAAILAQKVDVLLTDLRMPKGTGIELLRRLRRDRRSLPKKPAIIVNTGCMEGGDSYLQALGAEAIFVKPVSLPSLVATIQKLVN